MEVLPKALYHRQSQEVLLYERFFASAVQIVPPSVSLCYNKRTPRRVPLG